MRFAYVYFMKHAPARVREAAAGHASYWRDKRLPGYLGGPFADRSGGLIVFEAESGEQADRLASEDPFRREDLIERFWVKEWEAS
jgi:hypothetical protein